MEEIQNLNQTQRLLEKYKTPIYLYHKDIIENQYDILKNSLMPNAKIYFSIKSNPLMGVCRVLMSKGCGIETASKGEIAIALKSGCRPENIILAGPGKTIDDIQYAIDNKIKVINVESYDEIEIINEYSQRLGIVTDIALRVNPNISNKGAKIKMTGVPSQFGIDEDDIDMTFIRKVNELKSVHIIGIQIYMGTQILKAEEICNNTRYAIEYFIKLNKEYGMELKFLDCGGGFGVNYFLNEEALDMIKLKQGMLDLYSMYKNELKDVNVAFESGRFLMAESGVYIVKVLYTKISKGQKYIVCDGGSNFHAASAFLGRFVRNNFPIMTIPEAEEKEEVTIVGPLCTPTDIIGQKVYINKNIVPGDYIVIQKSGAYGLSHSPVLFLSHENPIEVMIDGKNDYILRERGTVDSFYANQI